MVFNYDHLYKIFYHKLNRESIDVNNPDQNLHILICYQFFKLFKDYFNTYKKQVQDPLRIDKLIQGLKFYKREIMKIHYICTMRS